MATYSAKTLLTTAGATGKLSWFKRQIRLSFRDEKPIVYKAQVVRGPVVKGDDLIAYAANAAHVPASTVRMAKEALFQAIIYYCAQGHPVEIPQLGTISVELRTKTARSEKELSVDNIMQKYLRWYPKKSLRVTGALANISLVENKELSKLAIAAGPDWKEPDTDPDPEPEP